MTIPEIVSLQKAFFESQKTKDVNYRLQLLKTLKQEILVKEQDIYNALYKDFKKSPFEAFLSEFGLVVSALDLAIKDVKKWSKPKRVRPSLLTFPSKDYIYKVPYGTVLIIAPWNYPFLLALEPLIMAIAAGNTVVVKPSELTEHTSKVITKIIENVFPKEIAISIEGGVETSTELLKQHWGYIFFTGSTLVGKMVAVAAAKHLTPVTLELGGKSPCIIDDTVDLKLTARRLVWGKLLNGGQTCIAPDYVIVKSNIKTSFIAALKAEIIKQYGENPKNSPDFPRIINQRHFLRLKHLLAGTDVVFGGDTDEETLYISPSLVNEPELDSAIMSDEIFGPILPILSFETEKDIERIIHKLENPLALYVFSKNKKFTKTIINKYSFGGGVVNDVLTHLGNHRLPFGGIGSSGMGQYHGIHSFNTFTHQKSIMKRGTWLDPALRYAPYKNKFKVLKTFFKYFG
ncbi:aldehyde dehydrogenase [Aestuariivivens insulae]|uniref:aldehyde dehydrogenase n=1 Tax=Aestuariivivens insulae TaxID=1621988 RepID=UPI001F5A333B|nr:aldehyde dehydrogenase [Aestuariivivens insulae]